MHALLSHFADVKDDVTIVFRDGVRMLGRVRVVEFDGCDRTFKLVPPSVSDYSRVLYFTEESVLRIEE